MIGVKLNGRVYLTPLEASRELALPVSTVFAWCKNGQVAMMPVAQSHRLKFYGLSKSMYLIDSEAIAAKKKEAHIDVQASNPSADSEGEVR